VKQQQINILQKKPKITFLSISSMAEI
jgi:hypothetical protein